MIFAEMSFLSNITSSGLQFADTSSDKRNIFLTNCITLIVVSIPLLLVPAVFFLSEFDFPLLVRLVCSSLVFTLPIILNRFGYNLAGRIMLTWLAPTVIFGLTLLDIRQGSAYSASSYVGLRLFLVPAACFPFLIFNLKDRFFMMLSLTGPLASLFLFDPIFSLFGAAYSERNVIDPLYAFNNVRAFISFVAIALSCYLLKTMVERNEKIKEALLSELAEKNILLQQQAEAEVHLLNKKLTLNLQQLSEREFILNQSQRIAKIGSWEYTIASTSLFCSDEVYNIFGLGKDFEFTVAFLSRIFPPEDCAVLINSTNALLQTGASYDLTLRAQTLFGHAKWIRITAFPVHGNEKILGARGICHDISNFKEAEDLLRASENKYRSLFEQASDFIMILDFEGRILDANASLSAAFGYSKEELSLMNTRALIDAQDMLDRPLPFSALARGEHFLTERKMIRRDRSVIIVESNVRMMQEGRILVIARDVTKLREVQREIELSEARFRGAFEFSAIGMALVSPELKWTKVNKELVHILGYAQEELLNMTVTEVTHADDREKDGQMVRLIVDNQIETFQREKRYLHKDGSVIWANLNVSAVKDRNDRPIYFVSQIEDITSRKKADELLLLSQANLHATINNTTVLIWSIDLSFRLLMFNNPFSLYMKKNYGMDVKIGTSVFGEESKLDEIHNKWAAHLLRLKNGESFSFEESRFGIDFHYSMSPIGEGGNVIGATVFADNITERKARELELAEANKKIGEFKLMALRSVMSPHFIFNVLNSIQFYIAKSDRFNAINYLSTFSKLIRSILTHSVDNKIRLLDEVDMLRNYIQLEMTRFEKKFNFVFDIDARIDLSSVQIPSLLIQPYVENAILHGLYNKTESGTLTVRIKENDDSIVFEIEDNGIGRAAAMKIREQNFPSHKSMGIRVTEERLKLINQHHHTAFEIVDLFDNQGNASGTRVVIRITI